MLNIQFSVQGDANDKLVEIQAKGVVAALYAIYGESILPLNLTTRDVTVATAKRDLRKVLDESAAYNSALTPQSPDASPSSDDIDAAEAFQGNTAEYLAVHAGEPDAAAAFGATPPVATPPAAQDVRRDSKGLPWDKRIHSGDDAESAGKNQDGSWKRRRNTPDATFDAVMAELKAANTQRTVEAAQGAGLVPPPPAAPAVPAPSPVPSAPSAPPAPPASSTAPAEGGLIDPASATAFPDIMKLVTKAQAAGKIDTGGVANLLSSLGVEPPSVSTLLTKKDYIPAFQSLLADHVAMQG